MKKISRMTRQKKIILEEIKKHHGHPTADELHDKVRKRLPQISLATVYRNLEIMAKAGQISKLESRGRQKRFDWETSPHDHIHCLQCQKIDNIDTTDNVDITLPGNKDCGYKVFGHRFEFFGLCPECTVFSKINNKGDIEKMDCKSKCGSKGLSDKQREVLVALNSCTEGACGSKDIVAATTLEAKQISCQITSLKKKGFVDSPVRCKYSITDSGKEALSGEK